MPWLETSPMDQRVAFVFDHERGLYTMTDLCARYGFSRKSGYKWLSRFGEDGRRGLADRSRAPHTCPHRMPQPVAQLLVAARRPHPSGGPRKLLAWLGPRHRGCRGRRPVRSATSSSAGGW
jgi:putative transposase